jgi:hypothetical protein
MNWGGMVAAVAFVGYMLLWFTIFIMLPVALVVALFRVIFG